MNITPLSTIADMADGLPVLAVLGTVKYAGKVDHGVSPKGFDWSKQFFVLADNGAEVGASLWDAEGNEMKKGETVVIENVQNEKKQWLGMVKGSYTNKKKELCHTLEIRANQVKIKPLSNGGERPTSEANISAARRDDPPSQSSKPESAARPLYAIDDEGIAINEAHQHIMQAANLYVLCIGVVDNYVAAHLPKIAQTSEQFQAAVGTLFIEASRAGLVAKMPAKQIKEKVERPPIKQEEESEVPF